MRIEFHREGGIAHFPGLSRPLVIDSDALAEAEASELKRLVEAARLFERPSVARAPRSGAADHRQYTIQIEDEGRQHTVELTDPVEDPELQSLVEFLQSKTRALRRGGNT